MKQPSVFPELPAGPAPEPEPLPEEMLGGLPGAEVPAEAGERT